MNTIATMIILHSNSLQFAVQQTCYFKVPPKITTYILCHSLHSKHVAFTEHLN